MLATKRSVGVGLDINLRNQLHTGDEACKQGIQPGLKHRVDIIRRPKYGYGWPTKRIDVLQNYNKFIFFKVALK